MKRIALVVLPLSVTIVACQQAEPTSDRSPGSPAETTAEDGDASSPVSSCAGIEAEYTRLTSQTACEAHPDCQIVSGQCGNGLGGCYHAVSTAVSERSLEVLGQAYREAGCTRSACRCAAPPASARCVSGVCQTGAEAASDPPESDACEMMAQIVLSDPTLRDAGGDGTWSPGEEARVSVRLTNTGDDNFRYPGIAVSASHPGVLVEMEGNWLYGMYAGDFQTLEIPVRVEASVPPGTVVDLVLRVDAINLDCDWNTATVAATIEAPSER